VLFNAPPDVAERGERGIAALPGRESEFANSIEQAFNYAQRLRCPRLHVMAGLQQHGASVVTYIDNLRRAAPQAAAVGVKLLVEPINPIDIPGYLINRTAQAIEVIEAVDASSVGLQFDLYHRQRVEGDLALAIERYVPIAEHLQIAQVPGRHEPDIGEIDYRYVFECIEKTGYSGWIGCEYKPRSSTLEGLGWRNHLCGTA
jgi:hydroxypyruvate isomerase